MVISLRKSHLLCIPVLVLIFRSTVGWGQIQPQAPVGTQSGDGSEQGTNAPIMRTSGLKEGHADNGTGLDSSTEELSRRDIGETLGSSPSAANGDYVLSMGDTIELVVYREPDLSIRSKIGNDGLVQLPLLGEIKLAGLSVRNASSLIRQKYDADYVVNPQIYLDVVSYHPRKFSVGGQVGHPGSYDFAGGDAPGLLDAIGMAGGFLSSADRSNIVVKRREGNAVKTYTLNAKNFSDLGGDIFQIQPGDDINVGEGKFTILGQVGRPGTYDFGGSDSLDLLEAIGMAGGFTRIADRGHILVKRRDGTGMRTMKVNAKKFSDDKIDQFEVKPGDVINVGESWY